MLLRHSVVRQLAGTLWQTRGPYFWVAPTLPALPYPASAGSSRLSRHMSDFHDVVTTLHGWLGHTVDAEIVFRSEARIATMRGELLYATEVLGGVESPETLHFTVGDAEFTL